jgi:hypothetical protein
MNEDILDFRFSICDWAQPVRDSAYRPGPISLTPRFSRVWEPHRSQNRFSGFNRHSQTAEAVQVLSRIITPLKRGVNDTDYSDASFQPPNRKSQI